MSKTVKVLAKIRNKRVLQMSQSKRDFCLFFIKNNALQKIAFTNSLVVMPIIAPADLRAGVGNNTTKIKPTAVFVICSPIALMLVEINLPLP